jgi:signal transduction histidine kinase
MFYANGNARLLEYSRELQKATERASALTNQLLDACKRKGIKREVLNLNDVIGGIYEMLQRIAGDGVEVSRHLAGGLRPIEADSAHLDQILVNLVVNARDAMPSGGKLTIETANIEVTSNFVDRYLGLQPGAHVLLAVSDTGTGMDATVKTRLFEPFFTTKAHDKGTGLGLCIVHEIVKQYGGEIRVYSEPGKGTTMKLYLPAHRAEASKGRRSGLNVTH